MRADQPRENRSAEPNPSQSCVDCVLVEGGRVVWVAELLDSFGVIGMVRVGKDVAELGMAPHTAAVLGRAGSPTGEADGVRYPARRQDLFDEHKEAQPVRQ
jgi:hypothetical protein